MLGLRTYLMVIIVSVNWEDPSQKVTERDLFGLFSRYGAIDSILLVRQGTRISFLKESAAEKAVEAFERDATYNVEIEERAPSSSKDKKKKSKKRVESSSSSSLDFSDSSSSEMPKRSRDRRKKS